MSTLDASSSALPTPTSTPTLNSTMSSFGRQESQLNASIALCQSFVALIAWLGGRWKYILLKSFGPFAQPKLLDWAA